jgi:hypothetical protein
MKKFTNAGEMGLADKFVQALWSHPVGKRGRNTRLARFILEQIHGALRILQFDSKLQDE